MAALALARHQGPRTHDHTLAESQTSISPDTFIRLMTRQRLVAQDEQAGATTSNPNAASKASKVKAVANVKSVQEPAVEWPWSAFRN
jgi:hypothetical protein